MPEAPPVVSPGEAASSASSLARMLAVLDLFNEAQLGWTTEAMADRLGVSLPTAYRYVKVLVDAGLLQRSGDAAYTLGARVIALDHLIRLGDPVLQHGVPVMQALVEQSGFDCVISKLYGHQLLDTHREYGRNPAQLSYGRGRLRPLFLGGAPKVILANLPGPQLHRLFDANAADIAQAGLPGDWPTFRRHFRGIRKVGHYFSNGELEPALAALAVPLLQRTSGPTHSPTVLLGAISLVGPVQRMDLVDLPKLTGLLERAAQHICQRIQDQSASLPAST